MAFIEELKSQLQDEALVEDWESDIDGMIDSEDTRNELLDWITGLRDEFIEFVDIVDDEEEIYGALINRYIELKCHWTMLNTKMQYQAVNTGNPDQSLMVKGTLASKLLDKLENMLGGREVAELTDFLADPLEILRMDRIEEEKLGDFMDFVGELVVTGEMYKHLETSHAEENLSDEFLENLRNANQAFQDLSNDLQESLLEIREVQVENHLQKYPVIVRKKTHSMDKKVEVNLEGEDTEVDRQLIEKLDQPITALIHFLVEIDIETPKKREEAGKDPTGTIDITVERTGDDVVFTISSDGRNLDDDTVRNELMQNIDDSVDDFSSLNERERLESIFEIGSENLKNQEENSLKKLDIIKDMGGNLELNSGDQDGIEIIFTMPRTQAVIVLDGLLVRSGDEKFIVPLDGVLESLSFDKANLTKVEDKKDAINIRGTIYPMHELGNVLNLKSSDDRENTPVVMILQESKDAYGLKVDEIIGQQKVVVRELGPVFNDVNYTSGSAVMGNGNICLVLDVDGLLGEVESAERSKIKP